MSLEKKRKELELARVSTARKELEFKVLERQDEISRLEQMIEVQIQKETELKKELEG